ncbi:MAG: ATP-dependent helicase, partial [Bacillota bacterium]
MDSASILKGLNPQQKKAVKHHQGPMLVLAGAGSGKTRVLTHRIAYLIEEYGVAPDQIMAVTFTNKAASEMKTRVAGLLNGLEANLAVSTFHSFCVRILRREIKKLDYDHNFVIFDTADQKKVIKEVLKELDLDSQKIKPRAVVSEISRAKNELLGPRDYTGESTSYFEQQVARIYPEYQRQLKDNNALDFGDLIYKTVELFREFSLVLEYYQDRFQYILI